MLKVTAGVQHFPILLASWAVEVLRSKNPAEQQLALAEQLPAASAIPQPKRKVPPGLNQDDG